MVEYIRQLQETVRRAHRGKLIRRLVFELDIGSDAAAKVQSQYAKSGRKAPERAGNVPQLTPQQLVWYRAWNDLSSDRPPGGFYAIPHSAIRAYAQEQRLDPELLRAIVRTVDHQFLEIQRKRSKQGQKHG